MAKNDYTEDNIKTLEWVPHIRKRPGMYSGSLCLGPRASAHDKIRRPYFGNKAGLVERCRRLWKRWAVLTMNKAFRVQKIVDFVCRTYGIRHGDVLRSPIAARELCERLLERFGCHDTDLERRIIYWRIRTNLPPLYRHRVVAFRPQLELKIRAAMGYGLDDYLDYDIESDKMSLSDFVACARVLDDLEFVLDRSDIILPKENDDE